MALQKLQSLNLSSGGESTTMGLYDFQKKYSFAKLDFFKERGWQKSQVPPL